MNYDSHSGDKGSSQSPSTQVQKDAVNPMGQRSTMEGSAGGPARPSPNQHLNAGKEITITPNSKLGLKG